MAEKCQSPVVNPSTLRWKILRQALLPSDDRVEEIVNCVSRKAKQGFNLIPFQAVDRQGGFSSNSTECNSSDDHVCVCYSLPTRFSPNLLVYQRKNNCATINDFEICNKYDIDNTGLVCPWPSEEILSFYCLSHADMFRSKKVIELGSGYGLAGLVIASVSEASEVVISDGNPQVIDYIQQSIASNYQAFGDTVVKPKLLHWNQTEISTLSHTFDIIVASDCTFFKEFHKDLARTVKLLLKETGPAEAIFISPKRGDSLDKFLKEVISSGLQYSISENYNERVWNRHQDLLKGYSSWPNYEADHCYPLLLKISR